MDGSKKEVREIDQYAEMFGNVQVLRFKQRIGIYNAWNACLEVARGRYITNANVDDIRVPWAMESLAQALDEDQKTDVVYGRYIVMNEYIEGMADLCQNQSDSGIDGNFATLNYRIKQFPPLNALGALSQVKDWKVFPSLPFSFQTQTRINSPHCAPMWRANLHHSIGMFDTNYQSAGDYEFWLRCLANGKRFKSVPDFLTFYYANPDGMSTKAGNQDICVSESNRAHKKWTISVSKNQMQKNSLKVLSVNTTDIGGGAERAATLLFKAFERRGHDSWLIVGEKKSSHQKVMTFYESPWINYEKYAKRAQLSKIAWAKRVDKFLGHEDFNFPFSKYLPKITGTTPDIVHCHNLHGGYFDLKTLSELSKNYPLFLTLHDTWLTAGHCTYSLQCERWKTGCGRCPHLEVADAISRDGSNYNWKTKQKIYQKSSLYIATPNQWLMDRVNQSMLSSGIVESKIIPIPIDTDLFQPPDPLQNIRYELGLPQDCFIVMYAAYNAISNPFKDYKTVRESVERIIAAHPNLSVLFLCIGESSDDIELGKSQIKHLPFQSSEQLVKYFQAADVYVHAANAENAGTVVSEAMSCGTPVVTTDVGGLSETCHDGVHGFVVPEKDSQAMANQIERIIKDPGLGMALGKNGAHYAKSNYDLNVVTNRYLEWFEKVRIGNSKQQSSGQ